MIPAALLAQFLGNQAQNFRNGPAVNPYLGGQLANELGGPLDDPYYVGGVNPYVGGPFENIKSNIAARQAGRHAVDQARIAERFAGRLPSPAAPVPGAAPSIDEGQIFESANLGGIWRRTGIILECPLNSAQQSVAAGATLAMSVEPEREVEILGFELSIEGGATNVEYQETLRASMGITVLAVGQDSMRAASGEGAGTMLSLDKANFAGFVAKSGRQINLSIKNNGAAALATNVSAITGLVKYVSPN